MSEKRKIRLKKEVPKEFIDTTEMFVLEKVDPQFKIVGEPEQEELFLQLFLAMSIDDRISYYFDNFESIFASLYPDDVGYFQFVPKNKAEFEDLEKNLTRINPKKNN